MPAELWLTVAAMGVAGFFAFAVHPADAAGQVETVQWDRDGKYEAHIPVPARSFSELCAKLAAGERVEWAFEAAAEVDFNVHYHEGKQVMYPARANATTASAGTLAPAIPQDYCWMWSNRTPTPVFLQVKLSRR
jgi:hypothetical protein